MRRAYLAASLALVWTTPAFGFEQVPLLGSKSGSRFTGAPEEWDLLAAQRPMKNTSYNLVFDSVASLLQRWPNTRYRNGHNLVPGIIPTGTVLYHGGRSPSMPDQPEWVATDPEHSIMFASGPQCLNSPSMPGAPKEPAPMDQHPLNSSCWHLSMAAVRPLKVLYFDGSSAAKLPLPAPPGHPLYGVGGGTMDTQDFLIWGETQDDGIFAERERIKDLCKQWGPNGTEVAEGEGFDGFVRMEMDFEVMICDFSASFALVTVVKPAFESRRPSAEDASSDSFTIPTVIEAGSWHNGAPGETRVVLDLPHLISFFDDSLFPSLSVSRSSQERWEHRVKGISPQEVETLRDVMRKTAQIKPSTNGVDWKAVIQVITDRYTERLEIVQGLLNTTSRHDIAETGRKVQSLLRIMLAPYIPITFTVSDFSKTFKDASTIFYLCSTTTTKHLVKGPFSYTASERLMLEAIRKTNKEICRVVVKTWVKGALLGLDTISGPENPAPVSDDIDALLSEWQEEIGGLMKWLGWSVWHKCRPACGPEEMCYLPTWPFLGGSPFGRKPHERADINSGELTHEEFPTLLQSEGYPAEQNDQLPDWLDPQPSCVRRLI